MNSYIATFYTHYGTLKFHSDYKHTFVNVKPMPVPRALSASCGTCVRFEANVVSLPPDQEDLEGCYLMLPSGGYQEINPFIAHNA